MSEIEKDLRRFDASLEWLMERICLGEEEMEKHVRCFNMEGLTTKIMNAED